HRAICGSVGPGEVSDFFIAFIVTDFGSAVVAGVYAQPPAGKDFVIFACHEKNSSAHGRYPGGTIVIAPNEAITSPASSPAWTSPPPLANNIHFSPKLSLGTRSRAVRSRSASPATTLPVLKTCRKTANFSDREVHC